MGVMCRASVILSSLCVRTVRAAMVLVGRFGWAHRSTENRLPRIIVCGFPSSSVLGLWKHSVKTEKQYSMIYFMTGTRKSRTTTFLMSSLSGDCPKAEAADKETLTIFQMSVLALICGYHSRRVQRPRPSTVIEYFFAMSIAYRRRTRW